MEQLTIQINSIEDVVREIDNCHLKAFSAMIELGYILRKADDAKLFKERGFSSIFEFAKSTYGWDQSKTSRYMEINRQYSVGGYSTELLPRYEGYGPAKLSEMLTLPELVREEITTDMKREDIREIKREYKAAEQENKETTFAGAVQMDATEHGTLQDCVEKMLGMDSFKDKFERIYRYMQQIERNETADEEDLMYAISGGIGTTRVGSALIFWKKDNFKILKGATKEEHQYSDLIKAAVGIASTFGRDASEWYETVYKKPLKEPEQKEPTAKKTKKSVAPAKNTQPQPEQESEEREELPGQTTFEKAETEELPSFAPAHENGDSIAENVEKVDANEVEVVEKEPETIEMPENAGSIAEESQESDSQTTEMVDEPSEDVDNCCFCERIGGAIRSNDGTFRITHGKGSMCRIEQGIYHAIIELTYCPECGKEMKE